MCQIKSKKTKILFISWTFPPIGGSHSRRVVNLANYINQCSHHLDVLTVLPEPDFPLFDLSTIKYVSNSVNIYRVESGIYRKYNTAKKKSSNNISFLNKIAILFIEKMRYIGAETNIYRLLDWTIPAIRKGDRLIKRYNHDIIISSGNAETHIIAYIIKLLNKDVAWIVDYGDPWVFSPDYMSIHTKVKFIIDHWFETHILKSSTIITVTTDETKDNYLENYSFLDTKKIRVIPMATDYELFNKIHAECSEKFRLVYAGSIYAVRDITQFLNAVKLLTMDNNMINDIEILFVGNIQIEYVELVKKIGLDNVIYFSGFVSYEESLSIIKGAHILLSFGNKGGLQVPGKLFDYVGSKRPILWIKGDERDPALPYIENLNRVMVVANDTKDIYLKLFELYHLYKENLLNYKFDLEDLPPFSWEERGKALNEICDEILYANK